MPRGLIAGTIAAAALSGASTRCSPVPACSPPTCRAVSTSPCCCSPSAVAGPRCWLIRTLQRYLLNPLFRLLLLVGVNPYGLAILETRGRVTGKIRRVPVGNGRKGDELWIIAEHGTRAGWVSNIRHDPRVRIRLRVGLRYRWLDGIATVRPDEDPLARQRKIIAWHPLRALNAINVRVFGADLLVVHVRLRVSGAGRTGGPRTRQIME